MAHIKAICRIDRPALKGILDLGDEVIIEVITYDKDTEIVGAWKTHPFKQPQYHSVPVIAAAGSFKGYRFKAKNGHYYSDKELCGIVGPLQLDQIFEKVEK